MSTTYTAALTNKFSTARLFAINHGGEVIVGDATALAVTLVGADAHPALIADTAREIAYHGHTFTRFDKQTRRALVTRYVATSEAAGRGCDHDTHATQATALACVIESK